MSLLQRITDREPATLLVFVQDGAWQWGITGPLGRSSRFQVIDYHERVSRPRVTPCRMAVWR
jgi:hypothetical protein